MPQIPEFSVTEGRRAAAADALRPSEVGIEALQSGARNISRLTMERASMERQAGEDIGRGLEGIGKGTESIGQAVTRHQSLQEISAMGPVAAGITSSLTQDLSKAVQSNDPAAVQQFRDQMEDQLDQFQSQANTPASQLHAIATANAIRNHFTTAIAAESAMQSSHKVVADLGQANNILSDTVQNNPQALPLALNLIDKQVDAQLALHPDLTPAAAAEARATLTQKLKSQTAASAIVSVIHGNPQTGMASNTAAARTMIDQNAKWLTPEQQTTLRRAADVQDRLSVEQQKFDDTQARRAENDAGKSAITDVVVGLFDPASGQVNLNGAMDKLKNAMALPGNQRDPTLGISTFKFLHSLSEQQASGKLVQSDPTTLTNLQHRALLPIDDPNHLTWHDLYQAQFDHKLGNTDLATLANAMQRTAKSDLQGQMESKMVGSYLTQAQTYFQAGPVGSPEGNDAYTRFMTWFVPNLSAAQARGESPAQFIDQYRSKGPEFFDTFKPPPSANAGSGLFPASNAVPIPAPGAPAPPPPPPAEPTTPGVGALFHHFFGGK